jgi:hypothetical protein
VTTALSDNARFRGKVFCGARLIDDGTATRRRDGLAVSDTAEPCSSRFAMWPLELDLMARLAGMTLPERWSGWKREPFTGDSHQAHLRLGEDGHTIQRVGGSRSRWWRWLCR